MSAYHSDVAMRSVKHRAVTIRKLASTSAHRTLVQRRCRLAAHLEVDEACMPWVGGHPVPYRLVTRPVPLCALRHAHLLRSA